MIQRPPALSALGKARRRSSLLRPALTKSPRSTVRRTVTSARCDPLGTRPTPENGRNMSRLTAPLPLSTASGRVTTIGIAGCPSLHNKTTVRSNTLVSRSTRPPVSTTSARESTVPTHRQTVASRQSVPSSRAPVSSSRPPTRSSAVPSRPPSEVAQLKDKLAAAEQQLHAKKENMETLREMNRMIKDNLEMVKMQLEKVTVERDLKSQMSTELKSILDSAKETLCEREELIKELLTQSEEKEATMRKLHNEVVDLRGQIRVAVRVRPMLTTEKETSSSDFVQFPTVNSISVANGCKNPSQFSFEKVFTPIFSQKDVFENIEDFILSALHGFNVGLIAFGQTGSGKTHTMRGGNDEEGGVIPRAGAFLFKESKKLETTGWTFEFSLSFLEIYNNKAYDLLDSHQVVKLRLSNNDVAMDGLSTHPLAKLSDLAMLLARADKNRKTAATKCNSQSSRSHAVYMWNIKAHQESTGISTSSCLKLVDLAGSERAKESGAVGPQFLEMTHINTSLSVLQKCVALQKANAVHVPYRDSKLTQVLMDCLGRGNSKTMVIVNINPCNEQAQESKRSIEFASKMRGTNIGAAVQQRDL